MIRVPFFLIFSFHKGTLNQKGQKALLRNLVTEYLRLHGSWKREQRN